jgi:aspartyl protease family protein
MEFQKESYPLRGQSVVTVKVEINGVRGLFILDTGATFVAMKSNFADRAKISQVGADDITMATANDWPRRNWRKPTR